MLIGDNLFIKKRDFFMFFFQVCKIMCNFGHELLEFFRQHLV